VCRNEPPEDIFVYVFRQGVRGFLLIYFIYVLLCAAVLLLALSHGSINGIIFTPVLVVQLLLIFLMVLRMKAFASLARGWNFVLLALSLAGLAAGLLHHGTALVKLSSASILIHGLWFAYFLKSDRVRNTFFRG
jgi:hypothetical protein